MNWPAQRIDWRPGDFIRVTISDGVLEHSGVREGDIGLVTSDNIIYFWRVNSRQAWNPYYRGFKIIKAPQDLPERVRLECVKALLLSH